jgi:hypothetical protein
MSYTSVSRRVCGDAFLRPVVLMMAGTAVVNIPTVAVARPEAGKLSVAVEGSVDFPVSGRVHDGATAPVANLGPLNPALAGVAADLQIGRRSQRNIYRENYDVGLELAYGLSSSSEIFGSVRRGWSRLGQSQVGNAVVTTTVAGGPAVGTVLPINGIFGRRKSTDIELGLRKYVGDGSVRPYGALRAGIGILDKVNASFAIPAAGIAINDARFYKSSAVFSGGVDVGVSLDIGPKAAIQFESGLRYASKPRGDDTDLTGLGLQSINNGGNKLSVPATVRLRVGF